jgi:hypothetical protein
MTTIVCNRDMMACDLQFTHSNGSKFKGETKCMVFGDEIAKPRFNVSRCIIGGAGSASEVGDTWNWLVLGEGRPPRIRQTEFLMLTSKHQIFFSHNLINWTLIKEPYYAIGSGAPYALGSMSIKSDPVKAIKTATKHDPLTGLGYKKFEV